MPPSQNYCVKHLRLFGCRLNSDSIAVNWLLRHAGRHDAVEYIEVNVINSAQIPASFSSRNHFAKVPFLEITFDRTSTFPHGTKKVSDLAPWTEESPCTTQTADGKTIAEPNDRVLCLVEAGTICTFFAEHFGITNMWNPRSSFQRCRVVELCTHTELLARRLMSMVLVMLFAKTAGTSDEDAVTGIAAHERELLWSFRIMEDMLTRSEEAAAHAVGLDYRELLAIGEREVKEQQATTEQSHCAVPTTEGMGLSEQKEDGTFAEQDPTTDKGPRHSVTRPPTSPTLVALDAFIVGRSMSIADFVVASDLLVFSYLQSWLPSSLKQSRYPAILRHLERMRSVPGYEEALRPRLSFMKVFRRRPKIMASDPTMNAHAHRLRKLVDRIAADRAKQDRPKKGGHVGGAQVEKHTPSEKQLSTESKSPARPGASEPAEELREKDSVMECSSLFPKKKKSVAQPTEAPTDDQTSSAAAWKCRKIPQAFDGGRATQWAPCLAVTTPLLPPRIATLTAEDEAALQCSKRAVSVKRTGAQRDDPAAKPKPQGKKEHAAKTAPATATAMATVEDLPTIADTTACTAAPLRSATAQPQSRQAHQRPTRPRAAVRAHSLHQPATAAKQKSPTPPQVWSHDPYAQGCDHQQGPLPMVPGCGDGQNLPSRSRAPAPQRWTQAKAFQRTPTSSPAAPVMAPLPASSFICSSVPQSLAIDHFFARDPRSNPCGRVPM